jgi:hypothetical protein
MDNQQSTPRRQLFRGDPVFGLIFVLVGLGILYLFCQTSQLVCSQQTGKTANCSLRVSELGLIPVRSADIPGVQSARVEQDCSGSSCSYRVELVQANGLTPMTSYYSGGQTDKQATADQINRALQTGSLQNFSVSTPFNLISLLAAVVFAGAGIYAMLVPMRSGKHFR